MDEDLVKIDSNNRKKKFKDFFVKFKKQLILLSTIIILIVFSYFIYGDLQKKNKIKIADRYNEATIEYYSGNEKNIEKKLVDIIKKRDKTYSPLSLYFLLENKIIVENSKINELFDILINETDLEKEMKNLVIYKKALYNSEFETENNLIKILNPVMNSESIWKSHAFYLMAEYFYFKNEKQKSKEFFEKIVSQENGNLSIKKESQKRLNRDFSE